MRAIAAVVLLAAPLASACKESTPAPSPTPSAASSPSGVSAPASAVAAPPREGDPAPALVATAADGTKVDLAAWKGKHVVVYFYPKDDTPGCTKEACAFRDAWDKLQQGGIQVVGVSADDDASHKAFAAKYKLPFPLVADTDQAICKRFGVAVNGGYASRVTYLVGPDGKIKKVYPKVDPALHAEQILADAK